MKKKLIGIFGSVGLVTLSACAPYMERVAMTQENLDSIKTVDNRIMDRQKTINPTYQNSSNYAGVYGVLGVAIVDTIVNSGKDKVIKPIRAVVKKSEFANDLKLALDKEIKKNRLYNKLSVPFAVYNYTDKNPEGHSWRGTEVPQGKAFFYIPVTYRLSDNYDTLVIDITPEIKIRDKQLKTIYRNHLTYSSKLKKPSKKVDINIKKWTENKGYLIHESLSVAAKSIARELLRDMNLIDNKSAMDHQKETVTTDAGVHYNSIVVSKSPKKVVVRNPHGEILIDEKNIG